MRVTLPGVGSVRLRKRRAIPATFGRAFIVPKNGRWYAVFEAHRAAEPMVPTGRKVGLDRGVRTLVATSDGELIDNPRHGGRLRERVEQHAVQLGALTERDAAGRCRNRRDPARIAAARRLARAKEREANARRDHAHKASRAIIDKTILEDLKRVTGKQNLLFQIADAALTHPDGVVRNGFRPSIAARKYFPLPTREGIHHHGPARGSGGDARISERPLQPPDFRGRRYRRSRFERDRRPSRTSAA